MFYPSGDYDDFIRFAILLDAVETQLDLAVKDMKCFVLLLMALFRMRLPREHDDDLLAIFTVDDRDHSQSKFVKSLDAVMVRDFQFALAGHNHLASFQHLLHFADNPEHLAHSVARPQIVGQRGSILSNGPQSNKITVFRHVIRHNLVFGVWDGVEDGGLL